MRRGYRTFLALTLVALAMLAAVSCGGPAGTPTPSASAGLTPTPTASFTAASPTPTAKSPLPVEPNEAAVNARLVDVRGATDVTMPRWVVDMEVLSAVDIFGYANLVADKIGQKITVYTNQYMLNFSLGQVISCTVTKTSGGPEGTYFFTDQIK